MRLTSPAAFARAIQLLIQLSGAGEKKRLQAALDDAAVHQPGQGFRGKKGGAAGQAAEEVRAKEAQLAAERQKRSETERSALS